MAECQRRARYLIVVAAVLAAPLSCSLGGGSWSELESVAQSIPIPDSFAVDARERIGDFCYAPGCERPILATRLSPDAKLTAEQMCGSVEAIVSGWSELELTDEGTHQNPEACAQSGTVGGYGVQVRVVVPSESPGNDSQVVVSVFG